MALICSECGRDINVIGQDNMSYIIGRPLCEDCSGFVENVCENDEILTEDE